MNKYLLLAVLTIFVLQNSCAADGPALYRKFLFVHKACVSARQLSPNAVVPRVEFGDGTVATVNHYGVCTIGASQLYLSSDVLGDYRKELEDAGHDGLEQP